MILPHQAKTLAPGDARSILLGMGTVIIIVVLALGAILTFIWALNGMLTHYCPTCYAQVGVEENLIPVLPLARWWCPACSSVHKHADVPTREPGSLTGKDNTADDIDDAPPRI